VVPKTLIYKRFKQTNVLCFGMASLVLSTPLIIWSVFDYLQLAASYVRNN
jgi:hypothetical protein